MNDAGSGYLGRVRLLVDDKEIEAHEGQTLLETCLQNNIYIPNLCFLEGMEDPPASCRMCFVKIEGERRPVTACTVTVRRNMVVKTDTPAVRNLQRSALKLLLSVHHVDCARCPANKKCELQRLAKFLNVGLKPKGMAWFNREKGGEQEHPFLKYHPERCVLCGKCVYVCQKKHGSPFLTFAKRGFDTVISFYGHTNLSALPCADGIACVEICPVGALTLKSETKT